MPTNPKVARAFRAMRDLGITEDKVKPVLKNLLKLYEKNWDYIEAENYRVLADAIFDNEEAKANQVAQSKNQAAQSKKKLESTVSVTLFCVVCTLALSIELLTLN